MSGAGRRAGHAFISYAREDEDRVDDLQRAFTAAKIPVWRDKNEISPGAKWRTVIEKVIREEALVFIACFSSKSVGRSRSYQNAELYLAIEEFRTRRAGDIWIIPVRFDDCAVPDLEIGGGSTLASINHVDLFGADHAIGMVKLVTTVRQIMESDGPPAAVPPPAPPAPPPAVQPAAAPPAPRGETPVRPERKGLGKRTAIAITAAGVSAVVLASVLVFNILAKGPAAVASIRVPAGCQAQAGGLKDNELVGFVGPACFPAGTAMAEVTSGIQAQNSAATNSAKPYRTVVFFGVMSSSDGESTNPASLYQLRGIFYAQQQQNKSGLKFMIRVLLANAADEFEAGQSVARAISQQASKDHTVVAVLGIGQSRSYALSALRTLASLPVIGTSVTGTRMASPNFFQVSPGNARQAQLAARFAQQNLHARKVLVLANQDKYVTGKNLDLYSDDLAGQFGPDFENAGGKVIEVCGYGEQASPEVHCGGRTLSVPQLRDRICQEKPDLIFFAGRASTLPQLFTTPGGTCSRLPPVLGSSDVPKYAGSADLQEKVPEYGSSLYYISFAPARLTGCFTSQAREFQTAAMCAFLSSYRQQQFSGAPDAADQDAGLSYDSSDAMLGDDALQTVIQAIDASGNPVTDGAGVMRELDSGKVSFDGASGRISFSARDHAPPDHPVYVTQLGGTLTLQLSCGQFSGSAPAAAGGACPAIP